MPSGGSIDDKEERRDGRTLRDSHRDWDREVRGKGGGPVREKGFGPRDEVGRCANLR